MTSMKRVTDFGIVDHEAQNNLPSSQKRLLDDFLAWVAARERPITKKEIRMDWDKTTSTTRLNNLVKGLRVALDADDPLLREVMAARKLRRREMLARNAPKVDIGAKHWRGVPFPERSEGLSTRRLKKVDRFLAWVHTIDAPITTNQILRGWDASKTETPLRNLHDSLVVLMGDNHELCRVVQAASHIRCAEHRRSRQGQPKVMRPTRDQILEKDHWSRVRDQSALQTMPMDRLRLADRFFSFCTERRLSDIKEHHVLEFLPSQAPSRFWELRVAMEDIFGIRHPVPHVVEGARKSRWQSYAKERGVIGQTSDRPPSKLKVSVPLAEVPSQWLDIFTRLERGESVAGKRLGAASVKGMRQAARELIAAARAAGLPYELSIDTIRALDIGFDQRGLRPSSRSILTHNLWRLARALGEREIKDALHELSRHYQRKAKGDTTLKEARLASIPGLSELFDHAHELLSRGRVEKNAMVRTTLLVDAAAIAFLSLIPLRNSDTVIRWGEHLTFDEGASDGWCYRIDTKITKTDVAFGSALHPILNPFLESVLLQGRDALFLPKMRNQAIADRAPVFPTSNGKARCTKGLSARWQATLGAGSHIARTRVHTALGLMGPRGVDAALALCAQHDPETRKHYQANALSMRQMRLSQQQLVASLPEDLVAERIARFRKEQKLMLRD